MEEDELMSEVEDGPVCRPSAGCALTKSRIEREGECEGSEATEEAKPQGCRRATANEKAGNGQGKGEPCF
jgi:hypothetical protein